MNTWFIYAGAGPRPFLSTRLIAFHFVHNVDLQSKDLNHYLCTKFLHQPNASLSLMIKKKKVKWYNLFLKSVLNFPAFCWPRHVHLILLNLFLTQTTPKHLQSYYLCLVTQSCLTLCDLMECSTPGFPVLHRVPEFAQTHVYWVGDAIQSYVSINYKVHFLTYCWP